MRGQIEIPEYSYGIKLEGKHANMRNLNRMARWKSESPYARDKRIVFTINQNMIAMVGFGSEAEANSVLEDVRKAVDDPGTRFNHGEVYLFIDHQFTYEVRVYLGDDVGGLVAHDITVLFWNMAPHCEVTIETPDISDSFEEGEALSIGIRTSSVALAILLKDAILSRRGELGFSRVDLVAQDGSQGETVVWDGDCYSEAVPGRIMRGRKQRRRSPRGRPCTDNSENFATGVPGPD